MVFGELRYEGDALWMTQVQMASLFGRDPSVIYRHVTNILEEGELAEADNLQKMQIIGVGRPGTLYSLDMVISLGYRVSSAQATLFRKWTSVLVRFAISGFVVDAERLKNPDEHDRVREQRRLNRQENVDRQLAALKQADAALPKARASRTRPQKP